MTKRQIDALTILKNNPRGLSADIFAEIFWPNSIMHDACSNQGNGACRGKKAWLQAGSFLGKLIKQKGWVKTFTIGEKSSTRIRYQISHAGLEALNGPELKGRRK